MKNLKDIKTTIIGIAVLVFTGYNFEKLESMPFYILIALGIAFLFLPDTLISGIKRLVTRKSKEF